MTTSQRICHEGFNLSRLFKATIVIVTFIEAFFITVTFIKN